MDNNELYHYGVLGMKWGVRRDRRSNSSSSDGKLTSKSRSKTDNPDRVAVKKNKKKPKVDPIKDLSDDELRRRVNRLQLEQQYAKLSPKQVSRGKRFVNTVAKDILIPAATDAGRNVARSLIEEKLKDATKKISKK